MQFLNRAAVLFGLASATVPALAAGPVQYADVLASNQVNLRFIDLGFVAGSGFDGVKNWVELQITTTPTLEPPPFNATQLATFGLSPYPTVGQVQGLGNLGAGQSVKEVLLNVNEAAIAGFDYSKLSLIWTGDAGFPYPGAQPASFSKGSNAFDAGAAGAFDLSILFTDNVLGPNGTISSKLAFTYDGSAVDLGIGLFDATSTGDLKAAVRLVGSQAYGAGQQMIYGEVAAVPEPGTYALFALGLCGVGAAIRRRA